MKYLDCMRFRHAAALALVGWYLMLLPNDDQLHIFDVPWEATQRSFDNAKECEDARAKAVVPQLPVSVGPGAKPQKPIERAFYCISSDDPRLKSQPLR